MHWRAAPAAMVATTTAGLSLLELMATMAILAIVAALALPIYSAYGIRAERTGAQADLLRCAQGMERHATATQSYALAVDTDGDGDGDASTGAVSANICALETTLYAITLQSADGTGFVLRADAASATSRVADDGMLELDSTGATRWDRNDDGDFNDADENSWRL